MLPGFLISPTKATHAFRHKIENCNRHVTGRESCQRIRRYDQQYVVQATATLLAEVAVDQEEAHRVRAVVSQEESEVKSKAAQTQALADEAKVDLDQALPALNAAVDSLNSLNKGDIVEIKSMQKPPPLVLMTMEVGRLSVLLCTIPNLLATTVLHCMLFVTTACTPELSVSKTYPRSGSQHCASSIQGTLCYVVPCWSSIHRVIWE